MELPLLLMLLPWVRAALTCQQLGDTISTTDFKPGVGGEFGLVAGDSPCDGNSQSVYDNVTKERRPPVCPEKCQELVYAAFERCNAKEDFATNEQISGRSAYMSIVGATFVTSGQTVFGSCKLGKLPIPDPPICKSKDFDGTRVYRLAQGEYPPITCDTAKGLIFKTDDPCASSSFLKTAFIKDGVSGQTSALLDLPDNSLLWYAPVPFFKGQDWIMGDPLEQNATVVEYTAYWAKHCCKSGVSVCTGAPNIAAPTPTPDATDASTQPTPDATDASTQSWMFSVFGALALMGLYCV